VFNILVKKDSEKRKEEDTRFLIKKIKEMIAIGRDFEELAREYSEGPSAKKGGDLGLVEKGQMMKAIDEAIFSLQVGEISDIIESPLGYHVFMITEKIPQKVAGFETVKSDIEGMIYKKRIGKNLEKWLRELRKNAYISIK